MAKRTYPYPVSRGRSAPLGATVRDGGVNFALYSERAELVELLLFERYDDPAPAQVIPLRTRHRRAFNYWHAFVEGIGEGQMYGYRVHGPEAPERGLTFDRQKVLLDPYARGIVYGRNWSREAAARPGDNTRSAMKSLVVDPCHFDWRGIGSPKIPASERVIYELHVRGFTRHPSSGVAHPGTFAGLIEKIPYLAELGVTTVELLPVFQYDEEAVPFRDPVTGEKHRDYWGYNPLGFFAPHRGYYIADWTEMRYLTGFRDLVRAFHEHGIEVFLDVVFNHTTEGGKGGPTISFRGIENLSYYHTDPEDPGRYLDFSGCGNTVNCNHPIVRRLILDSLRYWRQVMHVDGFRFDLASILGRDERGEPLPNPPLTWEIESDPTLADAALIAEAWDAAGLYQVGNFPGERWGEWNGHFRDDVRRFLRGDLGMVGAMAKRMLGSPDLYEAVGRSPVQCINFVTCHDGFTLNDLVSYEQKHNERNGEDNRDGHNDNLSHNHGVEGPTTELEVEARRLRTIKNALALLFLAQGVPMILGGDEMRRTQGGNNNAWCQDNATSWVDWTFLERNAEVHRCVQALIRLRRAHRSLHRSEYLLGWDAPADEDPPGYTRVRWHGVEPDRPDWSHPSRTLAFVLTEASDDAALYIALNGHTAPISFHLPPLDRGRWARAVDTALPSPHEVLPVGEEALVSGSTYELRERSVICLVQR